MDGGSTKDLSNRGRRRSNSRDRQGSAPVGRRDSFESVAYEKGNGEEVSIRGGTNDWCGDGVSMSTLVTLLLLSSDDCTSVTAAAATALSNMVVPPTACSIGFVIIITDIYFLNVFFEADVCMFFFNT